MRRFGGQVAIVSGGSRGLGYEIARQLAADGALVTICGRDAESLDKARTRFFSEGLPVTTVVCDVRDRDAVNRMVGEVRNRHTRIDLVINDAGVIEVGPLADQTVDDYREAVDTHLFGPLHVMQAVLPSMRARKSGRIVNISSVGGIVGVPHLAPYSASKFALRGFSQAAGAELAADHVSVTCVCPGLMRTGSPDHAVFKGRNRAEFTWFALSDANPLLSMAADDAARRILDAAYKRQSVLLLSWTSRLASFANGMTPNLVGFLLGIAARFLPKSGGIGHARAAGANSHGSLAPSALTALDRRAQSDYNQL